MKSLLWVLLLSVLTTVSSAAQIVGVRSWSSGDSTRVVLELDGDSEFRLSEDSTPGRIVIQVPKATTAIEGPRWPTRVGFLEAMRLDVSTRTPRLLLDLNRDCDAKVFLLGPNGSYGQRLVIDLVPKDTRDSAPKSASVAVIAAPVTAQDVKPKRSNGSRRDMMITIDPGHGGEDPGAIGRDGSYEKNVTLAIGKALIDYLNRQDGVHAQLTRESDFFIPLQERRQIGRYKHKSDIFVSIHADSAPSRQAHGASVFALSLKGAGSATSRFAQQLAEQENKSDLIGGVAAESSEVGDVLANLLVEGSLKHSLEMGGIILRKLEPTVGKLHNQRVEQAGFAVLKEPGMVSLLVETGFISNPDEEARLTDPSYQRELAAAIGDGIVAFCRRFPVPGSYFSQE